MLKRLALLGAVMAIGWIASITSPESGAAGSLPTTCPNGWTQHATYTYGRSTPESHFDTLEEILAKHAPPPWTVRRDITSPVADGDQGRVYASYRGGKLVGTVMFVRTPSGWVLAKATACGGD